MADVTAYEVALLEENSRLRAEVEKLRAVRDAAEAVARWDTRSMLPLVNLRAALDDAKDKP